MGTGGRQAALAAGGAVAGGAAGADRRGGAAEIEPGAPRQRRAMAGVATKADDELGAIRPPGGRCAPDRARDGQPAVAVLHLDELAADFAGAVEGGVERP